MALAGAWRGMPRDRARAVDYAALPLDATVAEGSLISDWLEKQGPCASVLCTLCGLFIVVIALAAACVHRLFTGRWPEW